jgi:LDH2 family malate/lactate/ureidoglycolate dehydrogenase
VGACAGPEIAPLYERLDEPQRLGHLLIALTIDAFGAPRDFGERLDAHMRRMRALPVADRHERVYLPGEIEHEKMVDYGEHGIPLPPDVRAAISRLAVELGLAVPEAN